MADTTHRALAPGWNDVQLHGMPPCDGKTMFIGEDEDGWPFVFNEIRDGTAYHVDTRGELPLTDGLRYWRRYIPPLASGGQAATPVGLAAAGPDGTVHGIAYRLNYDGGKTWARGWLRQHQDVTIRPLMFADAYDIEQLQLYATRYEFLRSRDVNAIAAGGLFAGMTPQNLVLNGEDLDVAVDRARGAAAAGISVGTAA